MDGGAEAADPGELAGVGEADFETFQATHRKAGDGAVVAIFRDVILGLDPGQYFSEQRLGEEIGVVVDGGGSSQTSWVWRKDMSP